MKPYFLIFTVFFASFGFGQADTPSGKPQPKTTDGTSPVTVRGHTIGESLEQFTRVTGIPTNDCPKVLALTAKETKKQKMSVVLAACTVLSSAQSGDPIGIYTAPSKPGEVGYTFVNGRPDAKAILEQQIRLAGDIHNQFGPSSPDSTQWVATIQHHKLLRFSVAPDFAKYTFSDLVSELTNKYGTPLKVRNETIRNGYGAKLNVGNCEWVLPDGTGIIAREVLMSQMSFQKWTMITYFVKEYMEELTPPKPKALD